MAIKSSNGNRQSLQEKVQEMQSRFPGNKKRKDQKLNNPRKKKVVATFNMEHDDRTRIDIRKVILVVNELRQEGLKPSWFGLLTNPVAASFFHDIDKVRGLAVVEFLQEVYDQEREMISELLNLNKTTVVDERYYEYDDGKAVIRVLIDITKAI